MQYFSKKPTLEGALSEEKPFLSDHLQLKLKGEFGSVRGAAAVLLIPYERLKKSLQRNTFNRDDLLRLCPGESWGDLYDRFHFNEARRYVARIHEGPDKSMRNARLPVLILEGFSEDDILFITTNALVRERVFRAIKKECQLLKDLLSE